MLTSLKKFYPILLLTCGHGLVDSFMGLLQVLAPGLAAHLGIPLGQVVMLIGVSSLVTNLIQPAAAWVMGSHNLAWALPLAILASSFSVFMGFAGNIWILAAFIVIGAAGTGLYHPEAVLAAHDASGDHAHIGIPLFMAGGTAIYALITPLSIRITETYGFPYLTWFLIPCLLVTALFVISYRNRRKTHPSILSRPRSKRITVVGDGHISYWPLLATGLFICMATGLYLAILSSHYELRFGPEARHWSGWVLMVLGAGASLSAFLWASVVKRRGFYPVALATQLAAFPLFLLLAHATSPEMGFAVALPLCLVTPASMHPALLTLAKNAAGATQALRMSLMMGGTFGVASAAVMVAGALIERGVASSTIFVFVALCCLAAALLSAWQLLVHRKRQS